MTLCMPGQNRDNRKGVLRLSIAQRSSRSHVVCEDSDIPEGMDKSSKHETTNQCRVNGGPMSKTAGQHQPNIG